MFKYFYSFISLGLVAWCHSFWFICIFSSIETYCTVFITYKSHSLRPTPISSLLLLLLRKGISIGMTNRESSPDLSYSKPTQCYLSYASPRNFNWCSKFTIIHNKFFAWKTASLDYELLNEKYFCYNCMKCLKQITAYRYVQSNGNCGGSKFVSINPLWCTLFSTNF